MTMQSKFHRKRISCHQITEDLEITSLSELYQKAFECFCPRTMNFTRIRMQFDGIVKMSFTRECEQ
ncbi:MAG: hypothetical protein A2Z34_11845 [Planctomycetes bacterium RBG_16_59_8]|nr:MAG: hypothetical protein A2Z34_11845 [Planctomycetes bacterium RBG_16_59_8]